MNFFITGGAGFIGSHLIPAILDFGNQITIYDNFSNSSKEKIFSLFKKDVKIIEGDILDYDKLSDSMINHDFVIHLAAQIDVAESIKNPDNTKKINVDGTVNILNSCKKNNINNFIGISSAAVYGNSEKLPLQENSPCFPISPYGQSKLDMEKEIINFAKNNNLNSIILRIFNIYGIGQTDAYAGVITKFLNKIKDNQPLTVFGDGTFSRDFIHIKDVINAILIASKNIEGKRGNIYNIASGEKVTINELAKLVLLNSKKDLEISYLPPKKGDIPHSQADTTLAKIELNFIPKISLKEGVKDLF